MECAQHEAERRGRQRGPSNEEAPVAMVRRFALILRGMGDVGHDQTQAQTDRRTAWALGRGRSPMP